jgi:diadenosine tetraphosphate (Ap4A) HIT family hydrolase
VFGSMSGTRVAWDVPAYRERVRAACFVCELLVGSPGYDHHVIHRDDVAVAFLARYPVTLGHVLVAPIDHREHVIDDFSPDGYVRLQRVVHAVGRAVTATVAAERLYVLSLGSQQGNRHVHWHLAPLPPGTAYEDQQMAFLAEDRGWLRFEAGDLEALAAALGQAVSTELSRAAGAQPT